MAIILTGSINMRQEIGNIWDHHSEKRWIVITTNIGWKKDGANPMGAGIARQASDMAPKLAEWYGKRCRRYRSGTAVCLYKRPKFILFPTKPLNEAQPWMSWKNDSCPDLIRRSAKQLAKLVEVKNLFGDIILPLVGCQNGNLRRGTVVPILEEYLNDRFVLVERN